MPTATRDLTITRVFDAPRRLVFKLWTDPKHLARWWGPNCFTNPVCEVDPRPGGAIRIVMRAPDGIEHPMSGTFREVVEPERLVFVAIAEDKSGMPLIESLTTVTFAEHGGKTTVTVHARADAFVSTGAQMLAGMDAGWTQSLDRLADEARTSKAKSMQAEPEKEHSWLQQLVGEWTYETEAPTGEPSSKWTGTETVRSLGDLWVVAEGQGEMPGAGPATSIMTLGFDPKKKRYIGTWIGSMMNHLWIYDGGTVDADGRVLRLDADGPSMSGDGKMAKYQDIIEFKSNDYRTLTARVQRDDGTWNEFMTVHYRRTW
jgi:uncharacterized protein YndB with AHSA1/START domain